MTNSIGYHNQLFQFWQTCLLWTDLIKKSKVIRKRVKRAKKPSAKICWSPYLLCTFVTATTLRVCVFLKPCSYTDWDCPCPSPCSHGLSETRSVSSSQRASKQNSYVRAGLLWIKRTWWLNLEMLNHNYCVICMLKSLDEGKTKYF